MKKNILYIALGVAAFMALYFYYVKSQSSVKAPPSSVNTGNSNIPGASPVGTSGKPLVWMRVKVGTLPVADASGSTDIYEWRWV